MENEEISNEEEKIYCYNCNKELKENDKCYIDEFLFNVFGYVFCSEKCRNDYINSK